MFCYFSSLTCITFDYRLYFSLVPVNKTKTPEEIEKESDMNPEFEIDPILDILREADEKLNIIKATPTKKEKAQKKKENRWVWRRWLHVLAMASAISASLKGPRKFVTKLFHVVLTLRVPELTQYNQLYLLF